MGRNYRNCSKTSRVPRRPFEKDRIDAELKLVGKYGLKNKREVWRVGLVLSKIRTTARELLTLDEKDTRRVFEGTAMLKRLTRLGLLDDNKQALDYVLSLKTEDFLDRRLQTRVFQLGLAKTIHHARVQIWQRHIRVGKQVVDVPSFTVRTDSEKHIDIALGSALSGAKPGRVKRKKMRRAGAGGGDDDDEE